MARRVKQINRKPLHVKTGDDVIVISGDDKGKTPRKVLAVLPKERKVIVEGVNVMKDRVRQQQQGRQAGINEGGVVEKACPIHASKVMLVDPKSKTRTRVRTAVNGGKRERVATKSGQAI